MEPPPPSYDDVLNAGASLMVVSSPTTNEPPDPSTFQPFPPPLSQSTPSAPAPAGRDGGTAGARSQRRRESGDRRMSQQRSTSSTARRTSQSRQAVKPESKGIFEQFATFSMPNVMMAGMSPQKIDPELDIEAHLPSAHRERLLRASRRGRHIKCCCGIMWCVGFAILFCFVALPVAMILTGVFGMSSCPIFDNLYIIYLIVSGSFLALTVCLRLLSSGMTCCKITNCFKTEKSDNCTAFIIALEVIFCLTVIINIVVAFAGAVWTGLMQRPPSEEPRNANDMDFCSFAVFYAMCGYIGGMCILGILLSSYLLFGYFCYVQYKPELTPPPQPTQPRHRREIRRNRQNSRTTTF